MDIDTLWAVMDALNLQKEYHGDDLPYFHSTNIVMHMISDETGAPLTKVIRAILVPEIRPQLEEDINDYDPDDDFPERRYGS